MSAQDREKKSSATERGSSRRRKAAEPLVDLDELQALITLLKDNGLVEFEMERAGCRIHLRAGTDYEPERAPSPAPPVPAPVAVPSVTPAPQAASATPARPSPGATGGAAEEDGLHVIPSPIVGTFYRARSPNAEPFVKSGSMVEPDTVVCIIEAMKLMNEIQAETRGEVVRIYVENGEPVEYGQPLFGVRA